MDVHVGVLEASDWPVVAAIYTQGIEMGDATFETAPPEWSEWDSTHRADCRLVARVNGDVTGWAR
jgi:L-amino acid N-acyltransferase YncA